MNAGLCFDGFYSIQEMIELARMADETGMDSIWMSDHICFRDSIASATALLGATRRITVNPAPLSPYSRHPMVTAMALATMDEFAPGRVAATAGTANPTALREIGIDADRMIETMREYMTVLRRLLAGETVEFHGDVFTFRGARMGLTPQIPIPIYMTAVRPRMLRLAGEMGDGVLLSAGCTPAYIERCVREFRKGESCAGAPGGRKAAGFIAASVADDPREAMDAARAFLAYIFRNPHHEENIRLGGGAVDRERLAHAVGRRDWDEAKGLISDEVVHAHSLAGTPKDCRRRLDEFVRGGLDLPLLMPLGVQEQRKRVVALARDG